MGVGDPPPNADCKLETFRQGVVCERLHRLEPMVVWNVAGVCSRLSKVRLQGRISKQVRHPTPA